jgi:hypothetical protein
MLKTSKKILSVLMVILLVTTAVPLSGFVGLELPDFDLDIRASALAESGKCGDNVTYTYNGLTKELVISGTGEMYRYDSMYSNYFSPFHKSDIKSVVVEKGVTSIGIGAFYECPYLEKVELPDSLESIGYYSFMYCGELTSIVIPSSVKFIGYEAFRYCTKLSSITFAGDVDSMGYFVFNDTAYYNDYTNWEDGVLYIQKHLIVADKAISGKYTIKKGTTIISRDAFSDCKDLTGVVMPDSIVSIDSGAFERCTNLVDLIFSRNLNDIGLNAFRDCTSLNTVDLPYGIADIDSQVFVGCTNLKTVIIPDTVTSLGASVFAGCKNLVDIYLPDSINFMWSSVFSGCENLKYIHIPSNITKIDLAVFRDCKSLESISLHNNITSLGNYVFEGCTGLKRITIPKSVKEIQHGAFWGCENLINIVIDEFVATIGNNAFYDCKKLTDVYYIGSETEWNDINIGSGNQFLTSATIHYNHTHSYFLKSFIPASHLVWGEKIYECICGDSYSLAVEKLAEHNFVSEITTPATHVTEGLETNSCECGYSYTLPISKTTEHSYSFEVINPTCTDKGYTTYTCECGDSYVDDYVKENGHKYESEIIIPATHLKEGVEIFTCHCGDTYTKPVSKLIEHTHIPNVTKPTCTEQGYTTYTCECGDEYIGDYKEAKGHSYSVTMTSPSCTMPGLTTTFCTNCGDTNTKVIPAVGHNDTDGNGLCNVCGFGEEIKPDTPPQPEVHEHSYTATISKYPSCTEKGVKSYVCACGNSYNEDIVAIGHKDADGNGLCDVCGFGEEIKPDIPEDPSANCSCNCHKSGLSKILYKLILLFQKFFRQNQICSCGVSHY